MTCHLPHLPGKDNHQSKHGKIERCLQIMKKAGREKFTAEDVEDATGVFHLSVTRILRYTQGVGIKLATSGHGKSYYYFDGKEINVPVSEKTAVVV